MHPPALDRLLAELATTPGRVVLTGHLAGVDVPHGIEVVDLDRAPPPTRSAAVVLVVDDRRDLRALAFPRLGRTRTVACVLRDAGADEALVLPWLPTWPELTAHDTRLEDGGSVSVATFAERVAAHEVYAALAGAAGAPTVRGCRGLVIGFVRGEGQPVPPADPTYVEITPETHIADLVVPPDVVLSATPLDLDESPVTGRIPFVLDARRDVFVDEGLTDPVGSTSSYAWRQDLARRGGLELPPLPTAGTVETSRRPRHDPLAASPIGFDPAAAGPLVGLSTLDEAAPITALVADLRASRGVRIDQDRTVTLARDLAMAGIPLTADSTAGNLRDRLGDIVVHAIEQPVDLADPLAREEHSIVVRRAALDAFGGTDPSATPVSILLATKRPEMLDHVLAQVARQRGVDLELVLAPHGFEPDGARVRALLGDRPVQIVPRTSETPFGRVLADAAATASGEVLLKMDDDDWYGPDFVADLLRARTYSGAPVVGCATEYVYLSDRDLTIRQGIPAEKYTNFVAGGTLMIDRDLYRDVGGFRSVRKYVDAQLLAGIRAMGAAIYRTHGLGYVLRRNPVGHTWTLDADSLIVDTAVTTPGFTPSRLLEHDGS